MRHQMKAVFDDCDEAHQALDRLTSSGYACADAQLVVVPGARHAGARAAPVKWREHSNTTAARFLSWFLHRARSNAASGADKPQSPNSYLLTLATYSESEAVRAALLVPSLVRTGAQDAGLETSTAFRFARGLHESERFRNRSWSEAAGDMKVLWEAHDPAEAQWDASESALHSGWDSTRPEIDDDGYRLSHWKTSYLHHPAQPSARQVHQSALAGAVSKATWKEKHPGELTPWENFMDAVRHGWDRTRLENDTGEADYRLHHARTYPHMNYDDVAPVYRYGNNLRHRSAFQGRDWNAVEPELRAEWECGHREGKPLTWGETKAALHYSWARTKL